MTATLLTILRAALQKGRGHHADDAVWCSLPEEALLSACLANALQHDALITVIFPPGSDACAGPLFKLPRQAARAGRRIERIYLLAEQALAADKALHLHMALDREAGIEVTALYIGEKIASTEPAIAPLLNCALWHRDGAGALLLTGAGGSGWALSADADKFGARRSLIEELRRTSAPVEVPQAPGLSPASLLHEPLLASAPLARLAAETLWRRHAGSFPMRAQTRSPPHWPALICSMSVASRSPS